MNTSNKKDKSGTYQIIGNDKGRRHESVKAKANEPFPGVRGSEKETYARTESHTRVNTQTPKGNYVKRNFKTGRFEDLTVSYDSKGKPEGYIIQFDEYEDLRDRIDALEAHERIKQGGGIPHEVVKLELSGLSPLAAWRKYRGLTQQSLASAANITQPYIAAIESGKKDGTTSTIKQLAAALNTTIDNLID